MKNSDYEKTLFTEKQHLDFNNFDKDTTRQCIFCIIISSYNNLLKQLILCKHLTDILYMRIGTFDGEKLIYDRKTMF